MKIVFVTTTLYTKWLGYQSEIIKKLFPESKHIIVDGRTNWPNSWFCWINEVKKEDADYFVHIDEDFFITSKDEFMKVIYKMEEENIDLMGVPDGYHDFRGANPVAINTFLMYGKMSKLKEINLDGIQFGWNENGWINNYNLMFKDEYKNGWNYKFPVSGGSNFNLQQEPYYAFLWKMKELGAKFDYLYPYFDNRFKSTNPRLTVDGVDIGVHAWYTRQWDQPMDVHGMPNNKRYELIEKYISEMNG